MSSLETLYKKEYEDLENYYNIRFNDLESKSREMEESLNIKHQNEMNSLYDKLDEKLPKVIKYSKRYLELKSQEVSLAKQQKYKDAMLVKKKCEEVEIEDKDRFLKEKTEKVKAQSIKTANKHLIEKNSLKKRIETDYEKLKKEKTNQLDVLTHKFKNKKSELEMQQKMEVSITENKNLLKAKTTTGKLKSKQFIFASSGTLGNINNTYSSSKKADG